MRRRSSAEPGPRWAFRIALRLYPAAHREGFEAEMLAHMEEGWRRASGMDMAGRVRFWVRFWVDMAGAVPAAWLAEIGERYGRRRKMRKRFDTVLQDLRISIRALRRRPGLAGAIAMTLALGVSTTTTIFSVVEGVMLRPLPYEDPGSLVSLGATFPGREWREDAADVMHLAGISVANFADLRERVTSLEDVVAVEPISILLPDQGAGPELASAARVSDGFFSLLRVSPSLGRLFLPEDHTVAEEGVVLITHGAFERRYGADPSIIGTTLPSVGPSTVIVGVLPEGFKPPESVFSTVPDFWVPLQPRHTRYGERGRRSAMLFGRLQGGQSVDQARAEVREIAADLAAEFPDGNMYPNGSWLGIGVNGLHAETVGGTGRTLLIFLGASALLLILAALNSAMLLLARALDRTRELGVRMALGAGRASIVRVLITEAALLTLVGGGLGVLLAYAGIEAFLRYVPTSVPRTDMVTLNGQVLIAAVVLSVAAGMSAGLVPALRLSRRSLWNRLRGGDRAGSRDSRLRSWFVGGQVAIAVLLLSGAGLLVSSFVRIVSVDPGFEPEGLVSMRVDLKRPNAPEDEEPWQAWDGVLAEVGKVPGLTAVAATTNPPFQDPFWAPWLALPDDPPDLRREGITGYAVTPGYFAAAGTRLLQGRDFEPLDGPEGTLVAVVNETFVRVHLDSADPLGQTLLLHSEGPDDFVDVEIVGVVEDVIQARAQDGPRPAVYFPYTQVDWPLMQVMVRSELPTEDVVDQLRQAAARFNPIVPPRGLRTLESRMAETRVAPKFQAMLFGTFAAIALLLSAAGLYGALSHAVARRQRELGIRTALGAAREGLLGMVLRQGMTVAALGLAAGLAGAVALTRVLARFLFDVSPTDPVTFAGVSALLLGASAMACLVPALRATRVDPVEVMKAE